MCPLSLLAVKAALGWVGTIHFEVPSIEDAGIERMTIRFKSGQGRAGVGCWCLMTFR